MSQWPFRFVHAADFHLEQPLRGFSELPPHLGDALLDAPYRAAERVFEIVLAEEADFLILSGNILDPQLTGPRGPLALVEQFERLAQRGIAVYWAGGTADPPDAWPASVRLPDNVHVFPPGQPVEYIHKRDSVPLARLVGVSRGQARAVQASDFNPDPAGLFTVAVAHQAADPEAMKSRGIHYWALGGGHGRQNLFTGPQIAHRPGSPQGRHPKDSGPHGCSLVHVDGEGHMRMTFAPADAFRWLSERIQIDPATTRQDLETRLGERLRAIVEMHPALDLLISWTIAGNGPLITPLRRGGLANELLSGLRQPPEHASPIAWSVSLDVEPHDAVPAEYYEQQSIRGDFLRAVRHYLTNPTESLELEAYLPEAYRAGALGSVATLAEPALRERILREVSLLGVDLLSGEEPQP
jgi:DNA repair exonuclease SbcCD nuclease subunit